MKKLGIAFALLCLLAVPLLAVGQNSWEIVRADYGSGNNWMNVTDRVRSLVEGDSLNFTVDGRTLGAVARRGNNRVLRLQLKDANGRSRQIQYRDQQRVNLQIANSDQANLRVTRATYGSGDRVVDVTSRLNSQVQGDELNLLVNNSSMGGDPAPGQDKALNVEYTLNGRNEQRTVREGDTLRVGAESASYGADPNKNGTLRITRATYGGGNRVMDVTSRLNSQVQGNELNLLVNNSSMGGDPAPGQDKALNVEYTLNGRNEQRTVREGDTLRVGANSASYGDNQNNSLQITRATYGSGYRTADVTSRLNSQVQGDQLNIEVNSNSMGGDPAPGRSKTLTVDYVLNGRRDHVVVNEGGTLRVGANSASYGDHQNNSLQITRATYGSGYRTADVTSRLNSQVQGDQLNMQVNSNSMGGDPAPGQSKTLTVDYVLNGRRDHVVVNEGGTLRVGANSASYGDNQNNSLQITRATYGSGNRTADVTSRLNSQVQGDQLNIEVNSNSMGGDPAPGQSKTLTVDYILNGRRDHAVVNEGGTLRLPGGYGDNSGLARRVVCESGRSNNYGRKYCAVDTQGGVRLSRTTGNSECTEGTSWGYDRGGVWVDKGCSAEFETQHNGRSTGAMNTTTLPIGTELSLRTNENIDSKTATVGQTFSAVVAADVLDANGAVRIPKGSDAQLVIRNTEGGGTTGASNLVLDVDSLMVSGTKYVVSTGDVVQKGNSGVGANQRTAVMVGGGAAIGTLIGAIVGGGKGAAIGAAVGGGAGLGAQVLTKGSQVKVPAETVLNFRLDQELRLQASR